MRMGLILKCTHETGIAHGHNVLAIKAHVNTLIIMCGQRYFISLKKSQFKSETTTTLE